MFYAYGYDKGSKLTRLEVWTRIKEQTGIANENLEQLSFVFDGGVGLQGGVCGAFGSCAVGLSRKRRPVYYTDGLSARLPGPRRILSRRHPISRSLRRTNPKTTARITRPEF